MEAKILEVLKKVLPSQTHIIVKEWTGFYGGKFVKIMFAPTSVELHRVTEQFPQVVSLILDKETLELSPQIYGGMGGQCIYRKPNKSVPNEMYLAMKSVKIPFRTPKKEETKVLECIERFAKNWLETLRENKDVLMYQDVVNYDEYLK
jgi:RNA binding exosome subunit